MYYKGDATVLLSEAKAELLKKKAEAKAAAKAKKIQDKVVVESKALSYDSSDLDKLYRPLKHW